MKKPLVLRNVIFPIWMLYLLPSPFWVLLLPANFVIDTIVLLLAFSWLKLPDKGRLYRRSIVSVWLCGFIADLLGAAPLFGLLMLTNSEVFSNYNGTPLQLAAMLPFIALAGLLIYVFDRFYALRHIGLDPDEVHRVALLLALLTAPYTYLIPVSWFYV